MVILAKVSKIGYLMKEDEYYSDGLRMTAQRYVKPIYLKLKAISLGSIPFSGNEILSISVGYES